MVDYKKLIAKIKNKFKLEDNKRLLSNYLSLSSLQIANYILPLITLPYLVKTLGIEYYGLLAFASVTIAYFVMITNYGFNLTGTKEISIHRDDKEKILEIFSSIMIIKFLLMISSFIILSILVFSFEKFSKDWEIYFYTFGVVIGQILFPIWFFQGMERMKYIAFLNILTKSIFTIAVFIFIKEENDFYIVPILTSFGFLISGVWSLFIIKKEFDISFRFYPYKTIKMHLIKGWNVFLITLSNNLYESTTIFLVGIFLNNEAVGYFSIIDKVKSILRSIFHPITETIFPHMSKIYVTNKHYFYSKLLKALNLLVGVSILLFILFYLSANYLSLIIFSKYDDTFIELFKIMIFILPTLPLTSLLGPAVIIIGKDKILFRILFTIGVSNIILISIFAKEIGVEGIIYLMVCLQYMISISVGIIILLKRKGEKKCLDL